MAADLPQVLVRNTFLELVPEQLQLRRVHTTPAGGTCKGPDQIVDECKNHPGVTPLSEQSTAGDEVVGGSDDGFHSPREPVHIEPLFLSHLKIEDSLEGEEERFHSPREIPTRPAGCSAGAPPLSAGPRLGGGGLAVCVRNTFLDVRPPEPPAPLLRAATTPAPEALEAEAEAEPGPPPPAELPLEQFVTDDRFEEPSELHGAAWALAAAAGVGSAAGAPPPGLAAAHLPGAPCPAAPWPPPPPPAPPEVELLAPALPAVPPGSANLASVCQPNKLTCIGGQLPGWSRVQWAVDARKLEGKDKQAVSPEFMIDLPNHGPTSFRITIYPRPTNDGRGGGGFKKAKGRGRIELKCEAQLSTVVPDVVFHVGVGIGSKQQALRGPVMTNFSDHPCGGLPKGSEEWDFASAVDETRTFLVFLELAPPANATAVVVTGLG